MTEAIDQVERTSGLQKNHAEMAAHHQALINEQSEIASDLESQAKEIHGGDGEQGELQTPQMVLSSPAGIALTTPKAAHMTAGTTLALTAKENLSGTAIKSIALAALKRISLFAYKAGMKLIAASGKIEIHAQTDEMDIIADKNIKIVSVQGKLHISSPKEILLTAGGSYIKIDANGVESGTDGQFIAYASEHNFVGPQNKDYLNPDLPKLPFDEQFILQDENGEPIIGVPYKVTTAEGQIFRGRTDDFGKTERIYTSDVQQIKFETDPEGV